MIALVTGLSDSKYFSRDYDLTIGVNDCPYPVDHLLVADHPSVFKPDRLRTIMNHPAKLFTHIPQWNKLRQANMIQLAPKRSNVAQLKNKVNYCYSVCSPFIAVVHAFYQGSTEIHIAGVDITGHPNLGTPDKIKIIKKDFAALYQELKKYACDLYLIKSNPDGVLLDIIPKKERQP
jgi:hypothetical protein